MPLGISAGSAFVTVLPDTTRFGAALRAGVSGPLSQAERDAGNAFQRIGAKAATVGSKLTTGLSLPLAAIGGISVKMALDFERSFTRISAISNTSAGDIARWRGEVLLLSKETAQSPQELADALYFLASAGLDAGEVMDALELSAKGSAVGLGETADLARITANALNAYASSGLTATDVMDQLTAAIKAGIAEPDEFAEALGRLLPIASRAGVGFDEVVASLAALSLTGTDVNEGVTQMSALFTGLLAPTKAAAKNLGELGITSEELRKVLADDGVVGAMNLLEEATGGNIDVLKGIIPNIRALRGELGLTGENGETVVDVFHQLDDASGSIGQAFDETQKGPAFQMEQALNDLRVAAVELGEKLIPIAQKIVGVISDVAEAFTDLSPGTQDFLVKLGLIAIAAGPVLRILGGIGGVLGKLGGGFSTAGRKKDAFAKNLTGTLTPAVGIASRSIGGLTVGTAALAVTVGYALGEFSEGQDRLNKFSATSAEVSTAVLNMAHTFAVGDERVNLLAGDIPNLVTWLGAYLRSNEGAELSAEEMREALKRQGVDLFELRGRLLENVAAMELHGGMTKDLARSYDLLLAATESETAALDPLHQEFRLIPQPISAAEMAVAELTGAFEDQTTSIHDLINAQLSLAGGFLGVQGAALSAKDAQFNLAEAQQRVRDLVKDGKKGTLEYKEALNAVDQAQLGVVESQLSLASSVADYVTNLDDQDISQRKVNRIVREYGRMAGLSKGEIKALIETVSGLIGEYDRMPKQEHTNVTNNVPTVTADLQKYVDLLYSLPSTVDTRLYVTPIIGQPNPTARGAVFAAAGGAVIAAGGHIIHAGEGSYMTPLGRGGELVSDRGVMPLSDAVLDRVGAALAARIGTGHGTPSSGPSKREIIEAIVEGHARAPHHNYFDTYRVDRAMAAGRKRRSGGR